MRLKHDFITNKVIKHNARLDLHGGKQEYGMNYFKTYAPVVTWLTIRLMIVFGIIFCWALWKVDFVMAYPQAPVETDIYMELPQGIKTATVNSKDHILKLLKNIYGQKQAGREWNSFLADRLTSLGYHFCSLMIVSSSAVTLFSWSTWMMVFSWAMMMHNFYKQSRKSKAWDST